MPFKKWLLPVLIFAVVALSGCANTGIHQYSLSRLQSAGAFSSFGLETRVTRAFIAVCAKHGMSELYNQNGFVLELLDPKVPTGIRAGLECGPRGIAITVVELDDRYPKLKKEIDALRSDLEMMLQHEAPGVHIEHQEYGPSLFSEA